MKMKKLLAAALTAALVISMTSMTAMAAKRQKITSVSLTVEADIQLGGSIVDQDADVTAKSERYSVDSYEFTNSGFSWVEDDVPVLKVSITAADEYYFSAYKENVTVKGAAVTRVDKENSSQTMIITMTLTPLAEQCQPIETAAWEGDTGVSWSESAGAGSYEIKLYRDGKTVGTTKTTTAMTYDFSNALTKKGTYIFTVRPVNKVKPENKGQWTESPSRYIDDAAAARIRENGVAITGTWKSDDTGWWFVNADGSYTANNWQQIGGKWYFFNTDGYMMTGWIDWNGKQYYCDLSTGQMLVNTVTPDNHSVGLDGARY